MNKLFYWLDQLKIRSVVLDTIYDIGACQGNWSSDVQKIALPHSTYILFEANPIYKPILNQKGFKHFCGVVLSNPGRENVIFYDGNNTGDSYYLENTEYYQNITGKQFECITLDSLIQQNNLVLPNFIKLDTQGSELDILDGGQLAIANSGFILTECPIINYNIHAPRMQDYLDYFKRLQFVPLDVVDFHYQDNILVQIDILFAKNSIKEQFLGPNKFIRPLS